MFEQDRFLVRLQQQVNSDRSLIGCFLSGSYGRRQQDGYSDMDIGLLFASAYDRDAAWEKRRRFVSSILNYVPVKSFDGEHIRPYFHIALYSTGTKADFRFELKEELQPNPYDKDLRILRDSDGWIEQYQAQCARLAIPMPRIKASELEAIDQRFWVMFWDTLRLVLRGDMDKPFTIYVELLHFTLPSLIAQFPQGSPTRTALQVAQFSNNGKLTQQHLKQLLDAYLTARNQIVRDQHLDVQFDGKFETAVQQLIQRQK